MLIAIDGPVATGKSTIARQLADVMGFIFLDTGAMYRCITYDIINKGVNISSPEAVATFLKTFDFDMKILQEEPHYFVDGNDVTAEIRNKVVTQRVSEIAAVGMIRDKLVDTQRNFARGVNAIVEGRDMGTVVFPDADLKIFLTGRPEVRAKRRQEELMAKFPKEYANFTLEQALEELNQRDSYDSSRKISPLCVAEDAHIIDTSDLSPQEVIFKILELVDMI